MSEAAIIFYGRKFFPHLTPIYQKLAVIDALKRAGILKEVAA